MKIKFEIKMRIRIRMGEVGEGRHKRSQQLQSIMNKDQRIEKRERKLVVQFDSCSILSGVIRSCFQTTEKNIQPEIVRIFLHIQRCSMYSICLCYVAALYLCCRAQQKELFLSANDVGVLLPVLHRWASTSISISAISNIRHRHLLF